MGNVVLCAELFQPVCAAASGADDHLVRIHGQQVLAVLQQHALAAVLFQNDVLALGRKAHLHAVVCQIVLDGKIQLLRLLGAQMADGAIHQLQAGMDGVFADLLDVLAGVDALHMGVCAELQINFIGVVDQLLRKLLPDKGGQVAAHLVGKAQLAV